MLVLLGKGRVFKNLLFLRKKEESGENTNIIWSYDKKEGLGCKRGTGELYYYCVGI